MLIEDIFATYDINNTNYLVKHEAFKFVKGTLENLNLPIFQEFPDIFVKKNFDDIFEKYDKDMDGKLSKEEMRKFLDDMVASAKESAKK